MKIKFLLIFGLCLSLAVLSQTSKPNTTKKEIYCDKTDTVISTLKSQDYQEIPVWLGKSEESLPNFTVFVNNETKSWTIIQFNNDVACVLGVGDKAVTISKKSYI